MTLAEAKELLPGDEVYWNDPDKSADCSHHLVVGSITICGEIVCITTAWENLECYASELS